MQNITKFTDENIKDFSDISKQHVDELEELMKDILKYMKKNIKEDK